MKVLIWALSILITSIVAVIIKSAGITLGAIPTMILYTPLFFITPKLCKKWDEFQLNRKVQKWQTTNTSSNNSSSKGTDSKSTTSTVDANCCPKAITITDIDDLPNYYGKLVKLQIKGLENDDTFELRIPRLAGTLSEEAKKEILAKPLSKLVYQCEIDIRINVDTISVITAKAYEEAHAIYGILRRKGSANVEYLLTNAFIAPFENNLQRIDQALKAQDIFECSILDDGTIAILGFVSESIENLVIPEEINGRRVTTISYSAFDNNQTIKSLKIPNSVKTIEYSFSHCDNLETVDLGDGVESVCAFDCCPKLRKVYLGKSITEIENSFNNCDGLTAFDISPDNNTFCVIDGVLFSKDKTTLVLCPCGKKGKYIIPDGTKVVGSSAFENSNLEEIVISNTVGTLEVCAFAWTAGMKKLTIPSSVIEIEYEAITPGIQEIVIEQGSYAQQYFVELDDDRYHLTVVNKLPVVETAAPISVNNSDKLFCRRCGAQLPMDSDFCFKCGTKVEKDII